MQYGLDGMLTFEQHSCCVLTALEWCLNAATMRALWQPVDRRGGVVVYVEMVAHEVI